MLSSLLHWTKAEKSCGRASEQKSWQEINFSATCKPTQPPEDLGAPISLWPGELIWLIGCGFGLGSLAGKLKSKSFVFEAESIVTTEQASPSSPN